MRRAGSANSAPACGIFMSAAKSRLRATCETCDFNGCWDICRRCFTRTLELDRSFVPAWVGQVQMLIEMITSARQFDYTVHAGIVWEF